MSVLHASALSQVIINELLGQWGHDGFERHVKQVEDFYQRRRDLAHEAALKHLSGLCQWSLPKAGMFLWIKVEGVEDTWGMIMEEGLKRNIMLVPGKVFVPQGRESPFLRASYSIVPEDKLDLAFSRLAELIREERERVAKRRAQVQI